MHTVPETCHSVHHSDPPTFPLCVHAQMCCTHTHRPQRQMHSLPPHTQAHAPSSQAVVPIPQEVTVPRSSSLSGRYCRGLTQTQAWHLIPVYHIPRVLLTHSQLLGKQATEKPTFPSSTMSCPCCSSLYVTWDHGGRVFSTHLWLCHGGVVLWAARLHSAWICV